jgi:hypothetical protein
MASRHMNRSELVKTVVLDASTGLLGGVDVRNAVAADSAADSYRSV